MTSTEDRARAAMRAIAGTIQDAPPLQLAPAHDVPAPDEVRLGGHGTHRRFGLHRSGGPGGNGRHDQDRRWRSWLIPLTAAATVVALAMALVLVKDIPNGGAVPKNPAPSTVGPGGAPRYYVALEEVAGKTKTPTQVDSVHYAIVVGDSLTGKTLATFAPPARTTFQSVTADADDRTFVVFAVTSATGSFRPVQGATLTGSWYEVRLAPGTANPARLSKLPIKPWSWAGQDARGLSSPGQIYATALSRSGRELAVADIPDIPAADAKPQNWQEVKVFSVATGRLLHDWTENDPAARLETVLADSFAGVPLGTPDLTWIDGDRAVALATSYDKSNTVTGTVRRLNVAGPASGNLMTDSTIIWSGTLPWNHSEGCFEVDAWPPLISADGYTLSCVAVDMPWLMFDTHVLPPGTAAGIKPRFDYRATIPPEEQTGGVAGGILWVSPSADTLIVQWGGPGLRPATGAHFGVISHGTFTSLPLQANRAALLSIGITF